MNKSMLLLATCLGACSESLMPEDATSERPVSPTPDATRGPGDSDADASPPVQVDRACDHAMTTEIGELTLTLCASSSHQPLVTGEVAVWANLYLRNRGSLPLTLSRCPFRRLEIVARQLVGTELRETFMTCMFPDVYCVEPPVVLEPGEHQESGWRGLVLGDPSTLGTCLRSTSGVAMSIDQYPPTLVGRWVDADNTIHGEVALDLPNF